MSRCLVFPGQGSQYVGMGKSFADAYPAARDVFEEVDEALGEHLFRLMTEGPEEDLRLTRNTQPALMAASLAVIRVLAAGGKPVADLASHVAGHSLGEYSALAAAGSLSIADAARLLRLRGEAMQRAVPVGQGAMAAILGLDFGDVDEIADRASDGQVCAAANDNAPGQVVVSGDKAAVDRAIDMAKQQGAKRAMPLPVSAPFHCSLMQPAADEMAAALAEAAIAAPSVPVIANVTAAPVDAPDDIRDLLVAQVTGMVRWRESVAEFRGLGIDRAVEIGAGKVLSGLIRRIDRDIAVSNIQDPADLDAFVDGL